MAVVTEIPVYTVTLEPYELRMAALVGLQRHLEAVSRGLKDRYGAEEGGWNLHIEGACGELAVAKCLNLFWNGSINTFSSSGDVGKIQVRTRSKHDYELIVRNKDRDEDKFVLVTGLAPEFVVRGWTTARTAKRDEWRQHHGGRSGAWFVPQNALYPLDSLPL